MDSQIVNQQYVYLNSDYCEKKDNKYSCNVELQNKINVLNVISYVVPKSYFVISDGNNTIKLSQNGAQFNNITLTNGNYNIYQFCWELQKKLQEHAFDQNIKVSFDQNQNTAMDLVVNGNLYPQTGQIYFSRIGMPMGSSYEIDFYQLKKIFNFKSQGNFVNMIINDTYTKKYTGVLNLDPKTIYLCCDQIKPSQNYKNSDSLGESSQIHNVLQAINVQTTNFFNYMSANVLFSDYKDLSNKIENSGSYNFTFYFVDDKNNVIDFNNIPFFISLEFGYKMSKIQIGQLFSITDKQKTLNEQNIRQKFLSLENQPEHDINML